MKKIMAKKKIVNFQIKIRFNQRMREDKIIRGKKPILKSIPTHKSKKNFQKRTISTKLRIWLHQQKNRQKTF